MPSHHHYKLKDSFCKMHRPGLFNVCQLKNIPFNLTPGKIQLENAPSIQTGLFESIACVCAVFHCIYLVYKVMEPSHVNACLLHYTGFFLTSLYYVLWHVCSKSLL